MAWCGRKRTRKLVKPSRRRRRRYRKQLRQRMLPWKAGDAEKLDDVDKRQLEMERKKRDSHARYMRYYRSIRSRRPTCMYDIHKHACITCTCAGMCVCIHAMRSDPNTPPELRQMSREAHGSALSADFKIQHCIEHLHTCMQIMHACMHDACAC